MRGLVWLVVLDSVACNVKFVAMANRHISATPREAGCIKTHTIALGRELLRSYPNLKVNIATRKIGRLLLNQVTEVGVIVNPICPFSLPSLSQPPHI